MSALASRAGLIDPFGPPVDQLGALLRKMAEHAELHPARGRYGMLHVFVGYLPARARVRIKVCDGPLEDHPEWIWFCSLAEAEVSYWGRTPEEAVEKALAAQPERGP